MRQFGTKLRLIFIPYLTIGLIFISGYTFLHWLLLIRYKLFTINEEPIFIAPLLLIWVPLIIWLRPKVKLIKWIIKGRRDPVMLLLICAGIAIGGATAFAQMYLISATGELTKLNSISSAEKLTPTKYYTVKRMFIDKSGIRTNAVFIKRSKSRYQDLFIYVAVPLYDFALSRPVNINRKVTEKDTLRFNGKTLPLIILNNKVVTKEALYRISPNLVDDIIILKKPAAVSLYGNAAKNGALIVTTKSFVERSHFNKPQKKLKSILQPAAWLAIEYSEEIPKDLSDPEKELAYERFADQCIRNLNETDLNKFVYLKSLALTGDYDKYKSAIDSKDDISLASPLILKAINEPFESRNGNKIDLMLGFFLIGSLIFLIGLQVRPLRNTGFK